MAAKELKENRKRHVQTMRKFARLCGVGLERDDAKRDKVQAFAAAILASTGPEEAKRSAAEAFRQYEQTFEECAASSAFRLRGKSFFFTYNWDFLGTAFPDGHPAAACPGELWGLWCAWKAETKKRLKVMRSTSTLEESLHSPTPGRVHLHWKVDLADAIDETSTIAFAFHGARPDGRATKVDTSSTKKARGANYEEASNRAHFYTWAPKVGTLYRGTNWKPFQSYRVLGKWLDDLWTDGKLDHEHYRALALRVRVGFAARKRDLEQVLVEEREARVDQQLVQVDAELANLRAPFRSFPEVNAWEDSFLKLNFRWKLLVLVADSASGKSSFAESLFDAPYVLTVEGAEHLDLRGFDYDKNDGIVLDNVNSWSQLLRWRAVLQSRNAKSRGGQSATNLYSYVQYLYGVAVVATIDLDAPDAFLADARDQRRSNWLCRNCVVVRLPSGEAFFDTSALPSAAVENGFSRFAATVKRRRCMHD